MKIKREYYPYNEWEEYPAGLWRTVSGKEREVLLQKAIKFTGNTDLYGEYMLKAVKQWPISMLHNLSCSGMNRQAYIGHAACCIALNCPEDITREAWHYLTNEQREAANARADEAYHAWKVAYLAKKQEEKNYAETKIGDQLSISFG